MYQSQRSNVAQHALAIGEQFSNYANGVSINKRELREESERESREADKSRLVSAYPRASNNIINYPDKRACRASAHGGGGTPDNRVNGNAITANAAAAHARARGDEFFSRAAEAT